MSERPETNATETAAGWAVVSAREACNKIQDGTHFSPKVQLSEGRFRYLTAKNVRPSGLDLSDITFLREEDHRAIYARCDTRKGDVLLVKDGVNAGDAALHTLDEEVSLLSSVCFLRPRAFLQSAFLRYYLLSPRGAKSLTGSLSGTAIRRIVLERIRELPVLVAPIGQQDRIVAALDSQLSRLDEAEVALQRVQRNLKRYRATVLQAAVEGRLVPTEAELARAERRDYEPASELLKRILAERRRRWEDAELTRLKATGGAPTDDRWRTRYQAPEGPEIPVLPSLPEGWIWASVDALRWAAGYGTSQKCRTERMGPPVLRIPNIQDDRVSLDDLKYATCPGDLREPDALGPGDFLFIRTNGSRSLIGRGALIERQFAEPHYFASYLIRLRLVRAGALADWLALVWQSEVVRRQILEGVASSAGQYNLSLGAALRFAIPLPPVAEQARILERVADLTSIGEGARVTLESAGARSSRLRQSILKWAFEGKLVDQDPNDEPASVLLDRIRQARAAEAGHGGEKPKRQARRAR